MNYTWLHIGPQPGGTVRLSITGVTATQGIGSTRLLFAAEAATKDPDLKGCPLFFHGRLDTLGIGGPEATRPLAPLIPLDHTPVLREVGHEEQFYLYAGIDDRQLRILEEHRAGPQKFRLSLQGTTVREGAFERFHAGHVDYTVPQAHWITILEQVGFARRFLLELDAPDTTANPRLAEAVAFFDEASKRYSEGDWRHCVESLRQALAAMVGKRPEDEDTASDVQAALKKVRESAFTGRVGYDVRTELVRQAAKFYCDLAAHPDAAETRRHHAHAALVTTSGILAALSTA